MNKKYKTVENEYKTNEAPDKTNGNHYNTLETRKGSGMYTVVLDGQGV